MIDDLPDLTLRDPERTRLIAGLTAGAVLFALDVALLVLVLVIP